MPVLRVIVTDKNFQGLRRTTLDPPLQGGIQRR